MSTLRSVVSIGTLVLAVTPAAGQTRPDFSGIWRLDPEQSQLIGGSDRSGEHQLTWLVDHREPVISVVVNVRDEHGSHEYQFRCSIGGSECVNELPELGEVRRVKAAWEGNVLRMEQRATTPHGNFTARDRLSLSGTGDQLVFERIVANQAGERHVRQVFRKLGPHPSQRRPPPPLPSVELPAELARVLRDYEQHWRAGNVDSLVALFTEDGFVARRGGWIRGSNGLRESLQGTSSELRLRAVAFEVDGRVGYIIGNYGYGLGEDVEDRGMFILTLRREGSGPWLITADLDGAIRAERSL